MVRWTTLRRRRRSHSRWKVSVGTAAKPSSVRPQQHPVSHTKSWPRKRATLTGRPSRRTTMLRRRWYTGPPSAGRGGGGPHLGHPDQRVARDQRDQRVLAHTLGAGRPLRQHHVAHL